MRLTVVVLLALIVPPVRAQQPASAPPTLTLRGVVVTANDVPLPRVRVGIASVLSQQAASLGLSLPPSERGVLTDDRGQFTIQVPATASLRLAFTKARYTTQSADIAPRDLAARGSEIRVRLPLAGAISGQVLDRSGARLMSATVDLRRIGAAASDAPIPATATNDLGEYRFGGLAEGRYVVTARPSPFALSIILADPQARVDAAAVEGPAVNVSVGVEAENITLSIDAPSELDRDAANRRPDPDPEAIGSVSGRVVTWDGTPIARAVVHAYRPFIPGQQVETDERGRYRIDRLIPGEYTVEVRKSGFNPEQYTLDRTPITGRGRSVAIKKDQAVGSVDVMLARGAIIAGTIVDEFGEPAQDVTVGAFQLQAVGGRTLRASGRRSSRTDDRGQYRIAGLQPGSYVVEAVVGDALSAGSGYLPQFYPGTLVIDQATPTKVDFSTSVTGIDITLIPTAAHRVTGVVVDSSGRPARGSVVLAVSERSGAIQREYVNVEIRADGSFEFSNVGPGDYVVQANGVVLGSGQQFATSLVTVIGSDPPPVQLRVSLGATLRGRVTYEGVPPGPSPLLDLLAIPTDHDRAPLRGYSSTDVFIKGDGSLEFKGLFGPTLIQARPQRNDWYLKSVVFKGQDLTDTPFDFGTGGTFSGIEVVISAFGATVTGRVTDDRGTALPISDVLVFSTLRERWTSGSRWVKTERLRADGAFTVTGLPPGDYWVAALDRTGSVVGGAPVTDPDVLESLSSRAVRITLGEGQSQDLTLRLTRR